LFSSSDNLPQLLHLLALFGGEQFGIADHVDEKDVADLQTDFVPNVGVQGLDPSS